MPGKEDGIIARWLMEWQRNVLANLVGIKALAESPGWPQAASLRVTPRRQKRLDRPGPGPAAVDQFMVVPSTT